MSEVRHRALRLAKQRKARIKALRETLEASIAAGCAFTDDDIGDMIEAEAARLLSGMST